MLQAVVNSDNVFQGFVEGRDEQELQQEANDYGFKLYRYPLKHAGMGYVYDRLKLIRHEQQKMIDNLQKHEN